MKYTIEGFSQQYATTMKKQVVRRDKLVTIQIDCTDLVILRWFVDFFPNMNRIIIDNEEYAQLSHSKMIEDLPILDISKASLIERMQKLVEFEILDYKFIKQNGKGTYSYYKFGKNYINLINNDEKCSNIYGVSGQTPTKDYSIKYNMLDYILS